LPGYLTLPVGSEGRKLPTIVYPHGGPHSRDIWGFDPVVQFLAIIQWFIIVFTGKRSRTEGTQTVVEAFEATLQEACDADLLLHVVDAASATRDEQLAEVNRVLAEIDAADIAQILVFNKLDRLDANQRPREAIDAIEHDGVTTPRVFVSALRGDGLDALRALIAAAARRDGLNAVTASPSSPDAVRADAPALPRTGT